VAEAARSLHSVGNHYEYSERMLFEAVSIFSLLRNDGSGEKSDPLLFAIAGEIFEKDVGGNSS
jgi:hypothetical protein